MHAPADSRRSPKRSLERQDRGTGRMWVLASRPPRRPLRVSVQGLQQCHGLLGHIDATRVRYTLGSSPAYERCAAALMPCHNVQAHTSTRSAPSLAMYPSGVASCQVGSLSIVGPSQTILYIEATAKLARSQRPYQGSWDMPACAGRFIVNASERHQCANLAAAVL